jgi:hypothetical protein
MPHDIQNHAPGQFTAASYLNHPTASAASVAASAAGLLVLSYDMQSWSLDLVQHSSCQVALHSRHWCSLPLSLCPQLLQWIVVDCTPSCRQHS